MTINSSIVMPNPATTRARYQADLNRPHYHFLPPNNWMNDPNGFIHWKGKYHLFYQHNPFSPLWGNMTWGHAVSEDLIHWTDLPYAIEPTPGSYDESGIFSGCAIDHDGVPTIFYTATAGAGCDIQTQAMATGSDDLVTWTKHPQNPIISQVPEISGQTRDFRDPFVWKEADGWYMVVGSRIQDVGGVVFLYRSTDLIHWEYLHPLLTGDKYVDGVIWECPNFFPLGDKWVLIISTHSGMATTTVVYYVGTYENHHFTPTSHGVLDYASLYAPLTTLDAQNRRLMFGWLRETRTEGELRKAGWAGVQSIPRVLALDANDVLTTQPVRELQAIRGQKHHYEALALNGSTDTEIRGLALDIEAEFTVQPEGECGVRMAFSSDGIERLEIGWNAAQNQLSVRTVTPQMGSSSITHTQEIPHALRPGESLRLRILLDGSVVEIIANDRTSITPRVYPKNAERNQVQVFGRDAMLHVLNAWEMPSIWQ